ncbi:MAG TPA: phosphatase PAP2 family protein [Candidatus Binatia bacterium]
MASSWFDIRRAKFAPMLEAGTLVSVLIVAGGVLLFAELMEMVGDEPHAFDRAVLLAFRNPMDVSDPIGPSWLELVFLDITSLGGATVLTLMTAAVIGFLLVDEKRAAAMLVFTSVVGGAVLSILLKLMVDRARPDLVPHLAEVHTASFPSGHAMLSAVVYLTLGALLSRVEGPARVKIYILTIAIFLTLVIGLSRVYLGVHWPTDVLAGWCAGAVWATFCWRLALGLQRRGEVESDVRP